MRGRAVCLFLFLFIPSLSFADFSGRVVRVVDGDTIEVLHNNRALHMVIPSLQDRPSKYNHFPTCPYISSIACTESAS
jgi:endonuclease YncB( thermonuclease family)